MTDRENEIIIAIHDMGYDRTNIPKKEVDALIYKGLKSLEAWGKVKEEIETLAKENNSEFINIYYLFTIIGKHLKEVENEP